MIVHVLCRVSGQDGEEEQNGGEIRKSVRQTAHEVMRRKKRTPDKGRGVLDARSEHVNGCAERQP
jgi:hypothetical protein